MSDLTWTITILTSYHKRTAFDCGEIVLNNYLHQLANQHAKNNISRTFIATSADKPEDISGFYTLSAGSIALNNMPSKLQKKLPQYPILIARIGRLAVNKSIQGQGLGEYLLMDALHRCALLAEEIGIVGVIVDAKHEKAKNFYLKYGFCTLTNSPLTLFIPIQDIIV